MFRSDIASVRRATMLTGDRAVQSVIKAKRTNALDVQIGHRVRLGRVLTGLSQERLAERLGLTFQQVQKYEKGANRVSAARLLQIAVALRLPIGFFYEGIDSAVPAASVAEEDGAFRIGELLASPEGLRLGVAFARIKDSRIRRHLAALVNALTNEHLTHQGASP